VVTAEGQTLCTGEQIQAGQRVWLAAGGQQLGTVWGHGSYVAPDWSADWLHREAEGLTAVYAGPGGPAALPDADQAALATRVKQAMRRNRYDASSGTLTVSAERAQAMRQVQAAASIQNGLWYARSPELLHSPQMEGLVRARVPGDIVFAAGALLLGLYVLRQLRCAPAEAVQAEALGTTRAVPATATARR
jgi:nitric oxide reductase large subunit